MMDKKRAKQILVAHACCMLDDKKLCRECPWRNTEDCSNTSFLEVLEEAILAVKGEYKTKGIIIACGRKMNIKQK